jgi:hypothetical protein
MEPEPGSSSSAVILERTPDEVPTPLAIAVADFCRRAGRPSEPGVVRLALARLRPDQDKFVRVIVDAEPEAKPLGPDALVDHVRGLSVQEAARREEDGYYVALARVPRQSRSSMSEHASPNSLPRETEGTLSPEAAHDHAVSRRAAQREEIEDALLKARGDRTKAAQQLGITEAEFEARVKRLSLVRRAQKIAKDAAKGATPVKIRKAGEGKPAERPRAAVPPPLPRRGVDRPPKGRLSQGTPVARDPAELRRPEGKAELAELIQSYKGDRRALLGRLSSIFNIGKGAFSNKDLDALLVKHGLVALADSAERNHLLYLFTSLRGDLKGVSKALKLSPKELKQELVGRGLWDEAERLRERFRRELFAKPTSEQVQLVLHRQSYLRDLHAKDGLEKQVRKLAEEAWSLAHGLPEAERDARLAERLSIGLDQAVALRTYLRLS